MCCRDIHKVKATIKKPARPVRVMSTLDLLAECDPGLGFLSQEDEDCDDAMDLDYMPAASRAAGSGLPSKAARGRTSSRQAGAKRPREQPASDIEGGTSLGFS